MHAELRWNERDIRIEYQWVGVSNAAAPTLVFLHEGLGSVALWKEFPDTLCQRLQIRGLVYSRPGYGSSTPRNANEYWGKDFMHQQAWEVLPTLLATLNVQSPWLLGHSDGGSIALLYASANRDEAVFKDSDQFILGRENIKDHLAFGRGAHYCAGAALARLELRVMLEELLAATLDFEVNGDVAMTPFPEIGPWRVPLKVIASMR